MFSVAASAHSVQNIPYEGYEYNDYEESVAAPEGYRENEVISAHTLGLEEDFNAPADMYYDKNKGLYILDSGNSRIVLISEDGKLI